MRPSPTRRQADARTPDDKHTLVRRLALAKLRELRRIGMSYRDIAVRFGRRAGAAEGGSTGGFDYRLTPERLLVPPAHASMRADVAPFLRALDAMAVGLGFFSASGEFLHATRPLTTAMDAGGAGQRLRREILLFASALVNVVELRALGREEVVEELATRDLPDDEGSLRMKGGYIGLDLFGRGPSVLITLERPASDPLSDPYLREMFGFTRQEARIARLLAQGQPNAEIAASLFISPHTVKRHVERILQKLGARSRAEVAMRVLQGRAPSGRTGK